MTVGLLSLIMSSQLLLPTVLSLVSADTTNTTTTTLLHTSLSWLRTIPTNYDLDNTSRQDMEIFIEGLISNVDNSSVFTLVLSCVNILTAFFMMIGSCCSLRLAVSRVIKYFIKILLYSCMMLPWLVLAMVEILTIAVPATIFFSLVGVYLYFKGLFLVSIIVMAVPASFLLLNFVLWLTVLVAYNRDEQKEDCQVLEVTVQGVPLLHRS